MSFYNAEITSAEMEFKMLLRPKAQNGKNTFLFLEIVCVITSISNDLSYADLVREI